jgi:hypothetical protein
VAVASAFGEIVGACHCQATNLESFPYSRVPSAPDGFLRPGERRSTLFRFYWFAAAEQGAVSRLSEASRREKNAHLMV